AQPLIAGIYTADPDELSLRATMPRFLDMERRERSVILALWRGAPGGVARAHGHERRALVALRHVRRRHGGADPNPRDAFTSGGGQAEGAGQLGRAGGRRLASRDRQRIGLRGRRADPVAGGPSDRPPPPLPRSGARAP